MIEKKRRLSKKKRHSLVLDHISIVRYVIRKIVPQIPQKIDHDDLYGAAMIGLVNASKKFDPSKGYLFKTFAKYYIRGAVLDELRAHDMMSRVMRDKYRKLEKASEVLEHKLGRQPSDSELAESIGISIDEYHTLANNLSILPTISVEDHWEDSSGNLVCIGDLLTDNRCDPQNKSIQSQAVTHILNALNTLPEIDRLYLMLHYVESLTMKEIGDLFGLHESRISQLITLSTQILKEQLSNTYL